MSMAANMVDFVRGFGERKKNARIERASRNYLNNPEAAIQEISQIDGPTAIAMDRQHTADVSAQLAAQQTAIDNRGKRLSSAARLMRGMPQGTDFNAVLPTLEPTFRGLGLNDEDIAGFGNLLKAGIDPASLDDDAFKEIAKSKYGTTVGPPGSHIWQGGKKIDEVPFSGKPVIARGGDGSSTVVIFNPNTNRFETGDGQPAVAPATAPVAGGSGLGSSPITMTVAAIAPHTTMQESHGNFGAVGPMTADGQALGARQVMPETARAIAARLNMPWRPGMMTSTSDAGKRYQKVIGDAALQDSIDFGKGDPEQVFAHYYGGSNRSKWGPKTKQYVKDMLARTGLPATGTVTGEPAAANAGAAVTPTMITTPGKPPAKGKAYRPATPQELKAAGYPVGSAAQVDQDGKMVNLKVPSAASALATKKFDDGIKNRGYAAVDAMSMLLHKGEELLKMPGLDSALGPIEGSGYIPDMLRGKDTVDASNAIDNLAGQIGMQAMTAQRALSSQGATGFGNLSNAEGTKLEGLYGSLKKTTSEKEFRRIVGEMNDILRRGIARMQDSLNNGTEYVLDSRGQLVPKKTGPIISRTVGGKVQRKQLVNGKWVDI